MCWAVDNWVARRFEASPADPKWTETECVALDKSEGSVHAQEEWALRFSQRAPRSVQKFLINPI